MTTTRAATLAKSSQESTVPLGNEPMTKLRRPQARGVTTVIRVKDIPPGSERPASSLAENVRIGTTGEAIKVAARFDQELLNLIQEHVDRLSHLTPEVITASDAMRSLVRAGTIYFREQERLTAQASAQHAEDNNDE
jgi:hypothetical protein